MPRTGLVLALVLVAGLARPCCWRATAPGAGPAGGAGVRGADPPGGPGGGRPGPAAAGAAGAGGRRRRSPAPWGWWRSGSPGGRRPGGQPGVQLPVDAHRPPARSRPSPRTMLAMIALGGGRGHPGAGARAPLAPAGRPPRWSGCSPDPGAVAEPGPAGGGGRRGRRLGAGRTGAPRRAAAAAGVRAASAPGRRSGCCCCRCGSGWCRCGPAAPFIDTGISLYRVCHDIAWSMFRAHPLAGVGLENFHRAWPEHYDPVRHDAAYGGWAEALRGRPWTPMAPCRVTWPRRACRAWRRDAGVAFLMWRRRGSAPETLGFLAALACALFFTDLLTERSTFATLGLLLSTSRHPSPTPRIRLHIRREPVDELGGG